MVQCKFNQYHYQLLCIHYHDKIWQMPACKSELSEPHLSDRDFLVAHNKTQTECTRHCDKLSQKSRAISVILKT